MAPVKPTLELLSSLSSEHILRALMQAERATRAELAGFTGLSKPTVSESVRRLSEAGAVIDTGERTTGRGRVGTYYALGPTSGRALVVSLAPSGLVAEAVDAYGDVVARVVADVPPTGVEGALRDVAAQVAEGPFRLAVVSAADPVDRETGRLVELPDLPFLLGALDAPAVLADLVDGPVVVDNDVNWAARAEDAGRDFAYLYLGEGLGLAVVSDGEVRRGHAGLAGEIAHVLTTGPDGSAMRLTDVFAALGLRRAGTTAIDVPKLLAGLESHAALARALAGVLSAVVALVNPRAVRVGGPWGAAILPALADVVAATPRAVPIEPATVTDEPALTAARASALEQLRDAIVAAARQRT
ncbi:ROK family transcriptional regulator [Solirubrobacter phytolaccae]|uniref:ROK family transcriptional regulator n=1 Tax=Solirubrobacter phytolaccae TaxID=1404360 RepID=A0A9X3SAH5_9ACTN|nr:ROK family transcriptional regulator [Solirubrobacter phytolaccae]MDA0183693.1 ROK family transcriptional regulator [Solirubrobacter phytolaccae]